MGTTERIARFVVETDFTDIPQGTVTSAKEAVMDGLGVTLAGSKEDSSRIMSEHLRETGGNPQAGVIGYGFKSSAPQAALANGTMAHALDYDDVLSLMTGHATVPILPVVLALGEAHHLSGKDVLTAFILGIEVEGRIGSGIGRRHYAVGWHATATLGSLGAAASASKLLGLSVPETRQALGIAASEAAGLRLNFGTMTKPFHAGNAARNGIVAAMLARKGFTASESILEEPLGFCSVLGGEGEYDLDRMTKDMGNPFAIAVPGLDMKPYPCCRFTHRSIDAMLHIVEAYQPPPDEVAEVTCLTGSSLPNVLIHHRPRTSLEGKFSMEYCMARALLDGAVRIPHFEEEKILEPAAQELLRKVRFVHSDEEDEGGDLPVEVVTVTLSDGRAFSHEVRFPRGNPENPMTREELMDKYRDCASHVLAPQAVDRSLELVLALEESDDITELAGLIAA
jgi:2-methylcitrate dehydratase PrpD